MITQRIEQSKDSMEINLGVNINFRKRKIILFSNFLKLYTDNNWLKYK